MKIYLAGMGADDKELSEQCTKSGVDFKRLITFAYKADAIKIIRLKRNPVKRRIIRKRTPLAK